MMHLCIVLYTLWSPLSVNTKVLTLCAILENHGNKDWQEMPQLLTLTGNIHFSAMPTSRHQCHCHSPTMTNAITSIPITSYSIVITTIFCSHHYSHLVHLAMQ